MAALMIDRSDRETADDFPAQAPAVARYQFALRYTAHAAVRVVDCSWFPTVTPEGIIFTTMPTTDRSGRHRPIVPGVDRNRGSAGDAPCGDAPVRVHRGERHVPGPPRAPTSLRASSPARGSTRPSMTACASMPSPPPPGSAASTRRDRCRKGCCTPCRISSHDRGCGSLPWARRAIECECAIACVTPAKEATGSATHR